MTFAFVFLVIGVAFGLIMPQSLTPWWFRFLREHYDDSFIIHILMKEAARDYSGWKKRTRTLEGLAQWADEIRQKTTVD